MGLPHPVSPFEGYPFEVYPFAVYLVAAVSPLVAAVVVAESELVAIDSVSRWNHNRKGKRIKTHVSHVQLHVVSNELRRWRHTICRDLSND